MVNSRENLISKLMKIVPMKKSIKSDHIGPFPRYRNKVMENNIVIPKIGVNRRYRWIYNSGTFIFPFLCMWNIWKKLDCYKFIYYLMEVLRFFKMFQHRYRCKQTTQYKKCVDWDESRKNSHVLIFCWKLLTNEFH